MKNRRGIQGPIYKASLDIKVMPHFRAVLFESLELVFSMDSGTVRVPESMESRVSKLYRPPPSKKCRHSPNKFLEEFALYLQQHTISHGHLIVIGDTFPHGYSHIS